MAKFDGEVLLYKLADLIKSKLNDKLTAIDSEKGNDFETPHLSNDAYFDDLDEDVSNFQTYCYFGINNNALIEGGNTFGEDYNVFFTIVRAYEGNDGKQNRKMLRYIRALKEIVAENFDKYSAASLLEVIAMNPTNMKDVDNDTFHKLAGVVIRTAIAP